MLKPYILITLGIAALTAILNALGFAFDAVNVALIYLFPVLFSAVYWGLRPSFYAAAAGVLAFDYFFVPPFLSFTVEDLRYVLSFGVYLAVAALTATLAARLKQQLHLAERREAHTAALYTLSRQMTAIGDIQVLLGNVVSQVAETTLSPVAVYLPDAAGELALTARSAGNDGFGEGEAAMAVARWVHRRSRPAGRGTGELREFPGLFVPLYTEERIYGVLAIRLEQGGGELTADSRRLLEAFAGLAASAIARLKLSEEAKLAQLTAESERLRTAILDSVSHELRTPLATIIGSATGLIDGDGMFTPADRIELLVTIRDGALRMNRLVTNLLGMVKLESGMLQLRRNWCDAGDMLGVVLAQVEDFRQQRHIQVKLPDPVPYFRGDELLLEQVLINVVSNAIKYSPDGSKIVIEVWQEGPWIRFSVTDEGVGIAPADIDRVFDKFYRGRTTGGVTGTGLGLAICKGIVEAHGGTIAAEAHRTKGAEIRISLPAETADLPNLQEEEEETL